MQSEEHPPILLHTCMRAELTRAYHTTYVLYTIDHGKAGVPKLGEWSNLEISEGHLGT